MKYKLAIFSLLGFIGLSVSIKPQHVNTDTRGMVMVNGGTFIMGLDSVQLKNDENRFKAPFSAFSQEYPAFRVKVVPFYIDKYEVTNADYKRFIDDNPEWSKSNIPDSLQDGNYLKDWSGNKYPKGKANYPVVYVCWYATNAYARWQGKRLPMEVEMECAAGGMNHEYTFTWGNGDADSTKVNYLQSHIGHTSKVGSYQPNSLGLYDMAGNVWEFCLDRWRPNAYLERSRIRKDFSPPSAADKDRIVIRGGSWKSPAVDLRINHRDSYLITRCSDDVGFRCAASYSGNR